MYDFDAVSPVLCLANPSQNILASDEFFIFFAGDCSPLLSLCEILRFGEPKILSFKIDLTFCGSFLVERSVCNVVRGTCRYLCVCLFIILSFFVV